MNKIWFQITNWLYQKYFSYQLQQLPDQVFLPSLTIRHIDQYPGRVAFGVPDQLQYDIWSKQACGIVSLKMLTDALGKTKTSSIYQLIQASLSYRTFIVPPQVNAPRDIKGVFHQGLLEFAQSLGLRGFRKAQVSLEEVLYYLSRGWVFLGSVNIYDLWGKQSSEKSSGSHIVLVIGFEKAAGQIIKIHYKDPATMKMWQQDTDVIDYSKFSDHFNQRGIFLKI